MIEYKHVHATVQRKSLMMENIDKFGEWLVIRQSFPTNLYHLIKPIINSSNFAHQRFVNVSFVKLLPCQNFVLYGIRL